MRGGIVNRKTNYLVRQSGCYCFRMVVPETLRAIVKQTEFRCFSLWASMGAYPASIAYQTIAQKPRHLAEKRVSFDPNTYINIGQKING
jgi:hypothetical protein